MSFFSRNDEHTRTALRHKPNRVYDYRSEFVTRSRQRSTDCGEVLPLMRSEDTVDILKYNELWRTIFSLERFH